MGQPCVRYTSSTIGGTPMVPLPQWGKVARECVTDEVFPRPSHRTTRLCACSLQLPPSFPCGNATSLNIALCARGRLNVSCFAHFIWHQAILKPPSRFAETVFEGGGAAGDGRSLISFNSAPPHAAIHHSNGRAMPAALLDIFAFGTPHPPLAKRQWSPFPHWGRLKLAGT